MPDIKELYLTNGLRLITIKKDSQIMALNLGFRVGSMMDPPKQKGMTHVLEHMLFTGTTRRSHDAINEEFEFLGGDVNAFTDLTQLILSVSALSGEMEAALDLVSDLVQNTDLTQSELDRERSVILSEYKEGLEDLETISYDLLYARAWPEEPLRYDVIGDEASIAAVTLADLKRHRLQYLTPDQATLVLASHEPHEVMQERVRRYFESWPARGVQSFYFHDSPNHTGEWETPTDSSEMATVTLLYHFPDLDPAQETGVKVLNRRLGDSDNSLLFREIRLKRGLSYDIYSGLDLTPHVRTLEVYCATEPENVQTVLQIILNIIADLKAGRIPLTEKDLQLSQKMHRTHIAALLDDTPALCSYVAANALDDRALLHYEEELREMENLSVDELRQVAQLVFSTPTISLLIPQHDEEEADSFA